MSDPLDALVARIRSRPKYRAITPAVIRGIGAVELARRRGLQEAVRATRSRLHQIAGVYLDHPIDYARYARELAASAAAGDSEKVRDICRAVMACHASSRERLPILEEFFSTIFAVTGPVRRILDLACGLDPLAIPWMQLSPDVEYCAYDIYEDLVGFLDRVLPLLGVRGRAAACDLTTAVPGDAGDVAFLLKSLPCLEHLDRSIGHRLLHTINAHHLVVSFPVRSLGGYAKGMIRTYDAHFRDLTAGESWTIRRLEFATELVFVVTRPV
ncbi:MAG: 16S rRNA methyltransferase [Chloroflexi bacterium]|nr:16S rRNA methyltransferase [Chloroflexota bacterium]